MEIRRNFIIVQDYSDKEIIVIIQLSDINLSNCLQKILN